MSGIRNKFTQKNLLKIKNKHKFSKKTIKTQNFFYNFSICGFISTTFSLITFKQLETLNKYLIFRLNKKDFKRYNFSFSYPIFKKSSKARMGKGIGKFYKWFGYIRPGSLIVEFYTNKIENKKKFFELFKCIKNKFSFKPKVIIYSNIFYKK